MKVRLSQPMSDLLLSKTANCRYPPAEADGRLIIPVGGLREPSLIHWSRIRSTRPNSTRVATPYPHPSAKSDGHSSLLSINGHTSVSSV